MPTFPENMNGNPMSLLHTETYPRVETVHHGGWSPGGGRGVADRVAATRPAAEAGGDLPAGGAAAP